VALHGSGFVRIGAGYSVVRVRPGEKPQTVLGGFLRGTRILGRPVDVLEFGGGVLVTDDFAGVIYVLAPRR
jgi:glucose/arabinose dehydrogenase